MKKIIYSFKLAVWVCLAVLMNSACSDWLDVKPKTEEEAERLFSSQEGFKSALAGSYITLCQSCLYGRELTYGVIGVLGKEWEKGPISVSASAYSNFQYYRYEETNTRIIVDSIWNNMYTAIANVNTLVEYTDKKKEVLRNNNYEIIKGEALALRAFIHFDLLRLFAEADFSEGAAPSIPYVKTASPVVTPQSTPAEVIGYIIEDLNAASDLLVKDPIFTGADVSGVDNGYLANRNFHLNYYAVQALKARVYTYAGKLKDANDAAQLVIDAQEDGGLFPWVSKNDINPSDASLRDRTFSSEHLFAFNTTRLENYIKGYFQETTSPLETRQKKEDLYEAADYRMKWFETGTSVFSKYWQMDKKTVDGVVFPKRDRVPAIRVVEMYYIAAEYLKTVDPASALDKLNTVRRMRGLTTTLENTDPEVIQQEIQKEYERELLGEGQVFFYHKRMGTKMIAVSNAKYVLPMPDQEIDLGQRE